MPLPPAPPPTIAPDDYHPPGFVDEEAKPVPWYRKTLLLVAWAVLVLILIGLIVYGIGELIGGGGGQTTTTPAPSKSTTATTAPTTSESATTTPPSSETTTPTSAPPTSTGVQPPTQQPTTQPSHHHHLPPLPSVITIPQGPTVTLPHGLP